MASVITKKIVHGNGSYQKECWIGLRPGDELIAKGTQKGLLDVGMSGMTIGFDSIIQGKIYKVYKMADAWELRGVAYICDEDDCLTWATTELFDLVDQKGGTEG